MITHGLTLIALLAAAPAADAPSALDARLAALADAPAERYLALRTAALADRALVDELAARAARATWSDATWRADAMAIVLAERARDPGAFTVFGALQGLDPEVYLRRRRAVPFVGRELIALGATPAALVEAALFPAVTRPAAKPFPRASVVDEKAQRAAEARAFHDGALLALAASRHRAAAPVLLAVARGRGDVEAQGAAAALVGDLDDTARIVPVLSTLLGDAAAAEPARVGAAVGLGKTRTRDAVELLVAVARDDASVEVRMSALGALGTAGNRVAHALSPRADSAAVRARVTSALVEVLTTTSDARARDVATSGIALAGTAETHAALTALAATTTDEARREAIARTARVLARALDREQATTKGAQPAR